MGVYTKFGQILFIHSKIFENRNQSRAANLLQIFENVSFNNHKLDLANIDVHT